MSEEATRVCPSCGGAIAPEDSTCGYCQAETATDFLRESPAELPLDQLLETEDAVENPLYECTTCGRLIELKEHRGLPVVPRFCPWCASSVSSIIGRELDGYRIDGLLSRGGFGIVYRASNITQPKMKAVVKILRPDLGYQRPELIRVFVEEARLTEEIGQTCFNVGQIRNVREKPWPYYLMEYVRGLTLDAMIDRAGEDKIPLDDCKGYLRGLAKALASTHAKGRVHRDLKPQNVMILEQAKTSIAEEKIKLLDFGLAMKIAGAEAGISQADHSATGLSSLLNEMDSPVVTAGTPDYMPPEAFDGINEFSGDIYSFGVTAFELLTSDRPWKDPRIGTDRFFYWRETHKTTPPRFVREIRPDAPSWLSKVVMRCLEKNPKNRFESANDLLENLREPIPRWVWGAAAAAIIVLGLFIWNIVDRALQQPDEKEIMAWRAISTKNGIPDPISPRSNEAMRLRVVDDRQGGRRTARYWVSSLDDLVETIFLVSNPARNEPLTEFSFGVFVPAGEDDPVKLEGASFVPREDNWLEIHLDPSFAVAADRFVTEDLPTTLQIEGTGRDKKIIGHIEIGIDSDPPHIGPIRVLSGKRSKIITAQGTLLRVNHVDVKFEVEIDEENMEPEGLTVLFGTKGKRLQDAPLKTSSRTKGSGNTWRFEFDSRFPLTNDGSERLLRIGAKDYAGNESRWTTVQFIADASVDVDFPFELVAGGNVFFKVSVGEQLRITRLYTVDDEIAVPFKIYPYKSFEDWRLLADALQNSNEFSSIDSSGALGPGIYFLAVELRRDGQLIVEPEKSLSLVVEYHDEAVPTNDGNELLKWDRPAALTAEQIVEEVTFVMESNRGDRTLSRGALSSALNGDPVTLQGDKIVEVRVKFSDISRVYRATIDKGFGASTRSGSDPNVLVLETETPISSQPKELSLKLVDFLGLTTTLRLFAQRDSTAPTVTVSLSELNQRVASWDEVELQLTSEEPLNKATVAYRSDDGREQEFDGDHDGSRDLWTFKNARPDNLKKGGGNYRLVFTATDLAGNEAKLRRPLVVNAKPPSITRTIPKAEDNLLHISGRLSLVIDDANGIDHSNAKVLLHVQSEERPRPLTLSHTSGQTYEISFSALEKNCEGTLALDLPDIEATFVEEWSGQGDEWLERSRRSQSNSWQFRFTKPTDEWRPEVKFRGLTFVKVGDRNYYLSKYEVPNQIFRDFVTSRPHFLPSTWSKKAKARKKPYPAYYNVKSGKHVSGDRFPVVGVTAEAASGCAREFAGRLPNRAEWREAALLGARGNAPWRLHDGKPYWHTHLEDWERESPESPYVRRRYSYDSPSGDRAPVPVHYDALDDSATRRIKYDDTFFHIIGNVGEIVSKGEEEFSVAGGDYDTYFSSFRQNIDAPFKAYRGPDIYTGFRILIHLDELTSDATAKAFLDAAKK